MSDRKTVQIDPELFSLTNKKSSSKHSTSGSSSYRSKSKKKKKYTPLDHNRTPTSVSSHSGGGGGGEDDNKIDPNSANQLSKAINKIMNPDRARRKLLKMIQRRQREQRHREKEERRKEKRIERREQRENKKSLLTEKNIEKDRHTSYDNDPIQQQRQRLIEIQKQIQKQMAKRAKHRENEGHQHQHQHSPSIQINTEEYSQHRSSSEVQTPVQTQIGGHSSRETSQSGETRIHFGENNNRNMYDTPPTSPRLSALTIKPPPPYGCLKGGSKPTYSHYKKTLHTRKNKGSHHTNGVKEQAESMISFESSLDTTNSDSFSPGASEKKVKQSFVGGGVRPSSSATASSNSSHSDFLNQHSHIHKKRKNKHRNKNKSQHKKERTLKAKSITETLSQLLRDKEDVNQIKQKMEYLSKRLTEEEREKNIQKMEDKLHSKHTVTSLQDIEKSLRENIEQKNTKDDLALLYETVSAQTAKERIQNMIKRVKKFRIKKTQRTYKLGKQEEDNKVSVLVKNNKTRKNIQKEIEMIDKIPIDKVKRFLRKKNLIKSGTTAPEHILRKLFRDSILSGDIQNTNKDILIHNYFYSTNK